MEPIINSPWQQYKSTLVEQLKVAACPDTVSPKLAEKLKKLAEKRSELELDFQQIDLDEENIEDVNT